ncbi:TonB-dependent receptor [Comamonas endophytica]|uniref:TonB-dependent receptor n=1 Tax=Comamonas endophytica TaxID=2949090 RepID=A0ABY6GFP7_9BURK|nr:MULTISPECIES: TonB-dependent receptor [unclassified Acidovorax]MCD2513252.1 TonB-dependent receptor [Acidovorax sp. D4N7]UYG53923.1 TonB-dependent receptor [Acidovorax sp. 5MLIR]
MSLRDTPASVEVTTRAQLEQRGDRSLVDAITRSAGITQLGHPGNSGSSLSVRGFTDTTSVMRLYDGTRQYGGVGVSFPFDTWHVERIEVLRGPASVVHGDGAIGGVVNIIPKKPTRGPVQSEVQATVGTLGQRALAFGSGGALSEQWSYRLDVSGNRSEGWVDRGDSSNRTFSGALRWDVAPDLSLQLMHSQGRQSPMRYFGTPLIDGVQDPALRKRNYNVRDSDIRYRDRWTELSAQWAPGNDVIVRSKLYHIGSDRYWRNAEAYAYNAATGLIDRSDNTEIGHDQTQTGNTTDVSVSGTLFGRANQLSLGFDINRAQFRHTNNTYVGSSGAVDRYRPEPGHYASAMPFIPRYRNEVRQHALFAEDRLELTDRWSVVGGLRYDHADLSRQDLVAGAQAFDRSYSHTGWRLGTVYQLRPELSLYAQVAQAADPVGGLLMLSPANAAFDSSRGRQLEVGLKQSFWQGRGDWTLAAYSITKNNLLTRDPANPALRVQVGERSSKGVEGTLSLQATRTLQIDANVALLRARYDDFGETVGGVVVSRNGKVPTDVPQHVANVWAGWKLQPDWTLSGGLRHVGKRFADNANTLKLPAYTTADLALQWQASPDTTLTLRGFNVFDKRYYATAYYTTSQWLVGEGRRYALTLNHRF